MCEKSRRNTIKLDICQSCDILDISSRLQKNAKTLYIDDLCVDESARGKGIGGKLFEYVESFGKSVGCDSITLNVWEQNTAARRFYDACGMTPQKTTMEKKI